ncbi:odorant receptor 13a-like [Andrena cerasifolii]|uniref:odorant receptor 13a-like n=1 Tax=Andrena cerasifolii TaxID=2819439 RepID=UPI0040384250
MATEGYSDISIRISTTFMKGIGLWLAGDTTEERRRKIMLRYTLFSIILASVVEVRDMYFSWGDWGAVLYIACSILSLLMIFIKVFVLTIHKVEFIELILYMQEDFWNASYNFREKEILDDVRKICIVFTFFVTLAGHCSIAGYLITPVIANAGKNESARILPFNMWLNLPLSISPYYEMTFVVQAVTLYQVGLCYFCLDNILCILCVHVSGQFRILQYRLTKLCAQQEEMKDQNANTDVAYYTSTSYAKLKVYIRQHQKLIAYCAKLENVFTMIALAQVLIFSIIICLFGYQIFMANSSFMRRCIFITTICGSVFMLLMFTYSCNGLTEQSDNVGIAAYSASWTFLPMNKFGRMFRSDLMLVILRSRKVCCVTANGFFPVSLETYTKILSTALSYYTLLRQNMEDATGS